MSESSSEGALNGVRIYDSKRRLQKTDCDNEVAFLSEQAQQRTLLAGQEDCFSHTTDDKEKLDISNNESELRSTLRDVETILESIDGQLELCNRRNSIRLKDRRDTTGAIWKTSSSTGVAAVNNNLPFTYIDQNRTRPSSELSSAYSSGYGNRSAANSSPYLFNSSTDQRNNRRSSLDLRNSVIGNEDSKVLDELHECYRKFCALEASRQQSFNVTENSNIPFERVLAPQQLEQFGCRRQTRAKRNPNKRSDGTAIRPSDKESIGLFIDKCDIETTKRSNEFVKGLRTSDSQRLDWIGVSGASGGKCRVHPYLTSSCGQLSQQVCKSKQIHANCGKRAHLSSSSSLPSALSELSDRLQRICSHASGVECLGEFCRCCHRSRSIESGGSFEFESSGISADSLDRAQEGSESVENKSVSDDYDEDDYCKAFEFETSNALESVNTDSPSLVNIGECDRLNTVDDRLPLRLGSTTPQLCCHNRCVDSSLGSDQLGEQRATCGSSLSLAWSVDYDLNQSSLDSSADGKLRAQIDIGTSTQLQNYYFADQNPAPKLKRNDSFFDKPNENTNRDLIRSSAFVGPNYKDFWCTLITERRLEESNNLVPTELKVRENHCNRRRLFCSPRCVCEVRSKSVSSLQKMGSRSAHGNELDKHSALRNTFNLRTLLGRRQRGSAGEGTGKCNSNNCEENTLPAARASAHQSKLGAKHNCEDVAADNSDSGDDDADYSASSVRAQTACGSNEEQQSSVEGGSRFNRGNICDNASDSMKTLKDVTKLSMPSLSSLQYLPAKAQVKPKMNAYLNCDSKTQDTPSEASPLEERAQLRQKQSPDLNESEPLTGALRQCRAASESKSDASRENSCLLHRICLCTCLARNQQQQPGLARTRSAQLLQVAADQAAAAAHHSDARGEACELGATGNASSARPRKKSKLKNLSSCAGSSTTSDESAAETNRTSARAKQNEKQSPSFMNLFRATTPDSNYLSNRAANVARDTSTRLFARAADASGECSRPSDSAKGSVGAVSRETESCAKTRLDNSAQDEQLHLSPETRRRSRSYGSETAGSIIRPNSSIRQQSSSSSKRAHKRSFLEGYKNLFGASKDSELELQVEEARKGEPKRAYAGEECAHKLVHLTKSQEEKELQFRSTTPEPRGSSFLSKSLHRFSGRSLARLYGRRKNVCSDSSLQSTCITPDFSTEAPPPSTTPSVSSVIDNTSTHSNDNQNPSSNSPDTGYSGPNSLLLTYVNAPEIVLQEDCDSKSGSGMSPQCDRHHHQRCSYQRQGRSSDARQSSSFRTRLGSNVTNQHQNTCHLSEGDSVDDVSSFGGMLQSDQWSSLPTSPQMRRRSRRSPTPSNSSSNYGRKSPRLSSSPVPFSSPPTETSKIEDGLQVRSIENFERHIEDVKSYQIEAQKRLFTAWINHFCPNLIRRDLIEELQDGIKLIGLLATLAKDQKLMNQYEKLIRDKQFYVNRLMVTPSSRLKHLSNVSISIDYLKRQFGMKLVNLNPMDIVSGKANVLLGLCWNIILNFQVERNLTKYANSSDNSSQLSQDSAGTSHFSRFRSNEDSANSINNIVRGVGDLEEYSQKDLLYARNRLLSYINRQFNLKLTNLSSNFVDGDVLRVILKQTLPELKETCFGDSQSWDNMKEDEKLELCFDIAQTNLNVPKLFNSTDLRRQIVVENNSKPMLVYLSMLLESSLKRSRGINTSQLDDYADNNDTSSCNSINSQGVDDKVPGSKEISELLAEVDVSERFDVENLQNTLSRLKVLEKLIDKTTTVPDGSNTELLERSSVLIEEAKRVEALIDWINRADELFESTQRSSADLAKAIENYKQFFSSTNIPKLPHSTHCPTLERQYQECLATAKQRILSMEQTMKNWISYERVRQELRQWLLEAEAKLANALRPNNGPDSVAKIGQGAIEQYQKCLDDLVDYFELEPVDVNDGYDSNLTQNTFADCSASRSLSSSLVSLGSTSSQTSTLTTSRSATHRRLFDDFEFKCRLLAAMLDADQRDALLLGVKELKSRLKYIVEWKVPQVVGELKFNINQCSMSILEQDEAQEAPISEGLEETPGRRHSDQSVVDETLPCEPVDIPLQQSRDVSPEEPDNYCSNIQSKASKKSKAKRRAGAYQKAKVPLGKQTSSAGKSDSISVTKVETESTSQSRSLLDWIWPKKSELREADDNVTLSGSLTKVSKPLDGKPNRAFEIKSKGATLTPASEFNKDKCDGRADDDASLAHRIWSKLVRASKVSLPFNIVLLICLAGLCVLPLLNKDACCELSQTFIPPERMTITQRPT